jgi:hypothetical protein
MSDIPFGTTHWSQIEPTEHKSKRGFAYWRTRHFGTIRVRMVVRLPLMSNARRQSETS